MTGPAPLLLRRGIRLEFTTLGWNVVGSVVVAYAAITAHSVALAGFGLDSLIEILASTVVIWHLRAVNLVPLHARANSPVFRHALTRQASSRA